jgi:hypothetical protein
MGLASSHSCFDGGLSIIVDSESQVFGVSQLIIWSSVIWGNCKACGVYSRLTAEPPFARGHVIHFIFR